MLQCLNITFVQIDPLKAQVRLESHSYCANESVLAILLKVFMTERKPVNVICHTAFSK